MNKHFIGSVTVIEHNAETSLVLNRIPPSRAVQMKYRIWRNYCAATYRQYFRLSAREKRLDEKLARLLKGGAVQLDF